MILVGLRALHDPGLRQAGFDCAARPSQMALKASALAARERKSVGPLRSG